MPDAQLIPRVRAQAGAHRDTRSKLWKAALPPACARMRIGPRGGDPAREGFEDYMIGCLLVSYRPLAHTIFPRPEAKAVHRHRCSVTTRAEVSLDLLASVLQAASPPSAREPLEAAPRGRDLLKLAHCRTDSSPGTCEF